MSLTDLPTEIQQEILDFLPDTFLLTVGRPVCRCWRDLIDYNFPATPLKILDHWIEWIDYECCGPFCQLVFKVQYGQQVWTMVCFGQDKFDFQAFDEDHIVTDMYPVLFRGVEDIEWFGLKFEESTEKIWFSFSHHALFLVQFFYYYYWHFNGGDAYYDMDPKTGENGCWDMDDPEYLAYCALLAETYDKYPKRCHKH